MSKQTQVVVESRKYLVWNVYCRIRGNEIKIASLPYGQEREATQAASMLVGGWIARSSLPMPIPSRTVAEVVALGERIPSKTLPIVETGIKLATSLPVVVEPVKMVGFTG